MPETDKEDVVVKEVSAAHAGQFALLKQGRFAPFFFTQFLGAANDNLFKFALTVLVTYQLQVSWLPAQMAGLVIGALFILPFVLLSATAGQWADKYDKARIMRAVKLLEIGIMTLAGLGFWFQLVPLLLACVLLMGLHSTFFGPVKYAYLPQHLSERELTGGNGLVEMGTFVAILLGNVGGGLLMSIPQTGAHWVAMACLGVAVLGWLTSARIPVSPASDPGLQLNWNPFSETWRNLQLARQYPSVFRSLLGISWMWFFGAVFLAQFPSFARDVLGGNEQVASLLLVVFSVGIAVGSLLCETFSHRHVEIGLVPIGALGMTVFAFDLYLASQAVPAATGALLSVGEFVAQPAHWRVMADLALLAFSAGLYSVPMYALIQLRAQPSHRARIIAANNILNALFMIVSSLLAGAMLGAGFSIPQVFGATAVLNILVVGYVFWLMPEYIVRLVMLVVTRVVYRLKVRGDEHLPTDGAAILVCNHVSFIDAVILGVCSPRPMVFLMDHRIFKTPGIGWFFRAVKAIPIAPQKEDPQAYEQAFERARQVLRDGDLLCLFPEGAITKDGRMQPFKAGIMKILASDPVPVIPAALHNLWGSSFSRIEGAAMARPLRRGLFNRIGLVVGEPIPPEAVTPEALQVRVQSLLDEPSP
ncbi:MAG: glycerol acyltransferase [Burkholderiales bacterium RIFCSPLOWO2_12_FULL_64_99]|nr:MAG: glycerol acyltransferase [Burkholderiales bacterium RIFCSPHIGHO2_12_FULL_63_20]OGB66651.1 MAG: glycerol acyltransferase [Burkholderiales bacterium RIFCSPLOWO2_12_FULL_64_99]